MVPMKIVDINVNYQVVSFDVSLVCVLVTHKSQFPERTCMAAVTRDGKCQMFLLKCQNSLH